MLNPVVIPLPVGVAAVAALALATWALRLWLEASYPLAFAPIDLPKRGRSAGGRHHAAAGRLPYRPSPAERSLAVQHGWNTNGWVPEPPSEGVLPQRIPFKALADEMNGDVLTPVDFDDLPEWEKDLYVQAMPVTYPDVVRDQVLPMPVPAPSWRDDMTTVFERPDAVPPPRHDDVSRASADTHPAPCAYPDLRPCICSVQEPTAVQWFGVPEDETRELEPVQ